MKNSNRIPGSSTGLYLLGTWIISTWFLFFAPICAQANGEWTSESPRQELSPGFSSNPSILFQGEPTLGLSGNGNQSVNGCWSRIIAVNPESFYNFTTHFTFGRVEEPGRSILARVIWLDETGNPISVPEYPPTLKTKTVPGWQTIQQTCRAPANGYKAKLELVFRWDPDGWVRFGDTSFLEAAPPDPRKVRVAAIHFRPRNSSTGNNLDSFSRLIARAAERKADIVLLPEGITLVGTGKSYIEAGEPIPGPSTQFMSKIARRNNLYLVINVYEREAEALYNTSVLLDRRGMIVGKYRKVCLPREEIDGGLSPGDSFPVFSTDFGKIGLMTCWDVFFPEPARVLARKGAEIIFLPIWGGNLDLAKARAIENQVYLVSSSYDMKTGIFDRAGELLVEGTEENPVAVSTIDLSQRRLWPCLGDFKNRIAREKPPAGSLH